MNSKFLIELNQGWMIILLCALYSCSQKKSHEYPFQNPELTFEERTENIFSLLTVEEKVQQMVNNAPEIERLGIQFNKYRTYISMCDRSDCWVIIT